MCILGWISYDLEWLCVGAGFVKIRKRGGQWAGKEKGRQMPAFFFGLSGWSGRGNSGNRAGIHTCAAINASFNVNNSLLSCLAYSVGRAGIITCAAIDAFVGNYVSQDITSFKSFLSVN